ncbi:hypothetical protein Pyn_12561 [Prunus yedoensis var. nudiflora]|uniref:Uncharacterized protein n=1 Tax=Prunus yedoensis var. nudiflora TaxID=2094558 RepID=A0A314XYS0_PRUYE|nr:hypothetical protein Pyn_12561 [Prunus yedoensis var. nudiflora]
MGQAGPASAGLVPNGFEPRVEGLNEHTLIWVFEDVGEKEEEREKERQLRVFIWFCLDFLLVHEV